MNDYIICATAADNKIRAFFATTKETTNKAFEIHKTSPVVSAAFGRMLTAGAIIGSMLKNDDDIITLVIKGGGPMKGVVVTSDKKARVKGYVYENIVDIPLKENGKLDVSGAIGEGILNVIKDIGLKEPYVGQIPLVSGEIAEDLTYYFSKSEQIPSAVALGVLVDRDYTIKQCGGFIIQLMPGADDKIIDTLEKKIYNFPQLTTLLEEGKSPQDIMDMLLGDFGYKVFDTIPVTYACNCSKKRVEKALISIGRDELTKILEEDEKATLHCHFCKKDYFFGKADIKEILQRI